MSKKKIALLLGQPEETYQHGFINGVTERAHSAGFDVCVFSMFIKYQNNKEREIGDSNIFNLVNYDLFDAVIVLSDSIQTPGVEKKLEKQIHDRFKGPVVCVDTDSEYFYSFWTDGYEAVYALISHLIEEHGLKDIAYLSGRKNHVHSQRRLEAYKDAMKAHDLEIKDERVFYGDFWYTSGTGCAEEILRSGNELPEAMVCANDCMAIGFAEEMERRGIRIPEDIVIAGYGTGREGQLSPKSLTSTYVPAEYYGRFSVDAILRLIDNKEMISPEPEADLFLGESCGCSSDVDKIYSARRDTWMTRDSEEGFYSIHNNLMDDLLCATSLEEMFSTVYESIFHLHGVRRLEICLSENWLKEDAILNNDFPKNGFTKKSINVLSYDADNANIRHVGCDSIFDTKAVFPREYDYDDPEVYIIVPLFFEDRSFGYAIMCCADEVGRIDEVNRLWMRCIARGLESFRRSQAARILETRNALRAQGRNPEIYEMDREEIDEVERILDNNLFTYHFQPIINAVDGEIFSYEALMRSATKKKISPLEIIKNAELLHRISDIEKATFMNVLTYYDDNQELFENRKVFINSIPGIVLEEDDEKNIAGMLEKYSGRAVVELTEQAEMSDDKLNVTKEKYRKLGVGLAVDDYGTGYSNVGNLLRYMPDYVKIDRSLLSDIQGSSQKQHFVREIIDFCHANDILALAEGVETSEELSTVIRLGADLIQGFYVARPSAEVISDIDSNIKMEISRYHREKEDDASEQTYIAGRINRISLNNLVRDGKTTVVIGAKDANFRDLTIIGTPNTETKIHIDVLEGYDGRITLENVNLLSVKNRPCIHMADNCHVTLRLVGDNRFCRGGIKVPESSRLTVEGDGNLKLVLSGSECWGIGNDFDKVHGLLEFYQDGEIYIESNGQKAIGIGSGPGGIIKIKKGKYTFYMRGNDGVGIGSFDGSYPIILHECDVMIQCAFYKCVCVGSINGNADINVRYALLRCSGDGKLLSLVGTIDGEEAQIKLSDLSYEAQLRSDKSTGLGALNGKNSISIDAAAYKYKGIGAEALVFGGDGVTDVNVSNANLEIYLKSDSGRLINTEQGHIEENLVIKDIIVNDTRVTE